jgi:hypothetical protein
MEFNKNDEYISREFSDHKTVFPKSSHDIAQHQHFTVPKHIFLKHLKWAKWQYDDKLIDRRPGLELNQLKRPKNGWTLSGLLQVLSHSDRDGGEGRQGADVDGILLRGLDDLERAESFLIRPRKYDVRPRASWDRRAKWGWLWKVWRGKLPRLLGSILWFSCGRKLRTKHL